MDQFNIKINGEEKIATKITMLNIADNKYLVYSVIEGNSSIILASKVIKDVNQKDLLVEIDREEDKEIIKNFINSLSK